MSSAPWSVPMRLADVGRGPAVRRLEPDETARRAMAKSLDLVALPAFSAEVEVRPWRDGAEIAGRWRAVVTYACGITLDPFDAELEGAFTVRAVPPDSPLAVPPDPEVELDLEADDPPDVLDGEEIDLGAYAYEHLALELDPFPRKPGVEFEPPPPENPESPFAMLKRLKE